MGKPFIVTTDASDFAIGAMLSQLDEAGNERPIAFESRKLHPNECNYHTTEKEMLAIYYAFIKWKPYLMTAKTTVFTDHQPLRALQQLETKSPRQRR